MTRIDPNTLQAILKELNVLFHPNKDTLVNGLTTFVQPPIINGRALDANDVPITKTVSLDSILDTVTEDPHKTFYSPGIVSISLDTAYNGESEFTLFVNLIGNKKILHQMVSRNDYNVYYRVGELEDDEWVWDEFVLSNIYTDAEKLLVSTISGKLDKIVLDTTDENYYEIGFSTTNGVPTLTATLVVEE